MRYITKTYEETVTMKKTTLFTTCLFLLICSYSVSRADDASIKKINESTQVISEIMSVPEKAIPRSLLNDIYGIAVIPNVIKAGFIVGGRYGQGILSIRGNNGLWSNPVFVTLTGGSIGWQIGAQSTDFILVFKTKKSIDAVSKGKFTLGADAAIAAGPVGRKAEAGTDVQMKAEIYSYSRSRGLFAGISLEGAALQVDTKANKAYYDTSNCTADKIFSGAVKAPSSALSFKQTLRRAIAE